MKEHRRKNSQNGATLIVALMICAMGALGVTAWVSVLYARNGQVDQVEAAIARRIRAENGRAAAREYFYRNVVTKDSGAAYTEALPDGWGGFTIAAWGVGAPMASVDPSVINHFSPVSYSTFTQDHSITINNGIADLSHTFRVRSRSPLLGGDLFTLHSPTLTPTETNTVSGNINVFGRAVIWTGEPTGNVNDLDAERYISPDVGSATMLLDDTSGSVNLPDNYPLTATTTNEFGGIAYAGELNVVDPGVGNEENSLFVNLGTPVVVDGSVTLTPTNGVSCNGDGRVYIDLDEPALGFVEVRNAFRLYLYGQTTAVEAAAAAGMNPVHIVLVRSDVAQRDLFSLRMFDRNSRPLNIGIKKLVGGAELWFYNYDSDSDPLWRLMLTLENTPARLINMYGGTVTIQGGIRTDRSVRHTGWYTTPGAIDLVTETAPGAMEILDARTAWVESYWQ